jgi:hypothetical protein
MIIEVISHFLEQNNLAHPVIHLIWQVISGVVRRLHSLALLFSNFWDSVLEFAKLILKSQNLKSIRRANSTRYNKSSPENKNVSVFRVIVFVLCKVWELGTTM